MHKILLVEDDPLESRMYQMLFSKAGYDVKLIENGIECHTQALEFRPDIIVLDIMMPKMNGFEALDLLHFDELTKTIPVMMLSNLSDEHFKKEALDRGATIYLVKSNVENKDLCAIIADIISTHTSVSATK